MNNHIYIYIINLNAMINNLLWKCDIELNYLWAWMLNFGFLLYIIHIEKIKKNYKIIIE